MLEVKVILHDASGGPTREVANMTIAQVAKGRGDLRDYAVGAWYQPMKVRARVEAHGSVVLDHDRSSSPWELILKAIASLHGKAFGIRP